MPSGLQPVARSLEKLITFGFVLGSSPSCVLAPASRLRPRHPSRLSKGQLGSRLPRKEPPTRVAWHLRPSSVSGGLRLCGQGTCRRSGASPPPMQSNAMEERGEGTRRFHRRVGSSGSNPGLSRPALLSGPFKNMPTNVEASVCVARTRSRSSQGPRPVAPPLGIPPGPGAPPALGTLPAPGIPPAPGDPSASGVPPACISVPSFRPDTTCTEHLSQDGPEEIPDRLSL